MYRLAFLLIFIMALFSYSCQSPSNTSVSAVQDSAAKEVQAKETIQQENSGPTVAATQQRPRNTRSNNDIPLNTDYLEISLSGKSKIYQEKKVSFSSDKKTGETTFSIEGHKVMFPDLLKNVRLRGMDSLLDNEFKMYLPDISSGSELISTITWLGPKIPTGTSGYYQALEGRFTGEINGNFRLRIKTRK